MAADAATAVRQPRRPLEVYVDIPSMPCEHLKLYTRLPAPPRRGRPPKRLPIPEVVLVDDGSVDGEEEVNGRGPPTPTPETEEHGARNKAGSDPLDRNPDWTLDAHDANAIVEAADVDDILEVGSPADAIVHMEEVAADDEPAEEVEEVEVPEEIESPNNAAAGPLLDDDDADRLEADVNWAPSSQVEPEAAVHGLSSEDEDGDDVVIANLSLAFVSGTNQPTSAFKSTPTSAHNEAMFDVSPTRDKPSSSHKPSLSHTAPSSNAKPSSSRRPPPSSGSDSSGNSSDEVGRHRREMVEKRRASEGRSKRAKAIKNDDSDSDDERRRRRGDKGKGKAKSSRRRKPRREDPDDEADIMADTVQEAADELELDEPERFKTKSRLRDKRLETPHQRLLRKLHNKRKNIVEVTSSEEEHGNDDDDDDSRSVSEGFITDDGEDFDENLLPEAFSRNRGQSQEYKFKVFFQYLLFLVVNGNGQLSLNRSQKEYMLKPVAELRDYVKGIRDGRVRSQIWKADFVKAMQKYPTFLVYDLDDTVTYCDACNRRKQHCRRGVKLIGAPYGPKTHEILDSNSEASSSDSDASQHQGLKVQYNMGSTCLTNSRLYHLLSHWEHDLYLRIKGHYHDLLRAKNIAFSDDSATTSESEEELDAGERKKREQRRRVVAQRVAKIRRKGPLPKEHDVSAITEWMDARGLQSKSFGRFTDLEEQARNLGLGNGPKE